MALATLLDLDRGAPTVRASALRLVLEEVERWQSWLEQRNITTSEALVGYSGWP